MSEFSFPLRTIHLDFHTGPDVPDVGCDFDAESFARTFKEAHVDSVTVVRHLPPRARLLPHRPSLPAPRPGPGPGPDRVPDRGPAPRRPARADLHHRPRAERVRRRHPSGVGGDRSGRAPRQAPGARRAARGVGAARGLAGVGHVEPLPGVPGAADRGDPGPLPAGGRHLPGHVLGPAQRVEVGGGGDDAGATSTRAWPSTGRATPGRLRWTTCAASAPWWRPPARAPTTLGIWFNSRPKTNLHVEKQFLRRVEIEALPTGGWGYAYFPYVARFVRPLGLPTLTHTGRFFKSWGRQRPASSRRRRSSTSAARC